MPFHNARLAALTVLVCSGPASAATITLQQGPTGGYQHLAQDFRGASDGSINNGAQALVGYQAGAAPGAQLQIRTVMSFDLSAIPAGSTINGVSLRLVSDGSQSGNIASVGPVNLHEVVPNGVPTNNMVEGQVTRSSWRTGSPWTNSLGDFTPTPLTAATLANTNANTVLDAGEQATFASTPAFVTAAQSAFRAGLPLEFILIAPTAEAATTTSSFFRFRSDDFVAASDGSIADRPLLTVEYTVPEPSAAGLLLGGAAVLFGRRRRPTTGRT